jgi:hypothetical protein
MRSSNLVPLTLLFCFAGAIGAQSTTAQSSTGQSTTPDDVVTQRLHQNSALYANRDKGESLRAQAARAGDLSIKLQQLDNFYVESVPPVIDPANNPGIKRSALQSDLVAVGHVVRITSALTPHESFIYSDAEIVLDSVWYQSSGNRTLFGDLTGKEVTVPFAGGQVVVDGHNVSLEFDHEHPLVLGHTYLLFLKYHPASNSYDDAHTILGFDVTGPKVTALYTNPLLDSRPITANPAAFLAATRHSVDIAKSEASK